MITTFLQIDIQNLLAAPEVQNCKIDFEKIWQEICSRETEFLNEGIVYITKNEDYDNSKFENKLRSIGYTVKTKDIPRYENKQFYRNVNHGIAITVDCMERQRIFEKWIFISGGEDFSDLARWLRSNGKKVELWGFQKSIHPNFETCVDRIVLLNEDYFYKKPKISVFGFNRGE